MNEQEAATLGLRIQAGRKAAGLSQEALGERLGVSRQAVSKWEADAAIPELENLIAMSRLFGVSVGVLLGVEEAEAAPGLSEQELQIAQAIAEKYAEQMKPAARPLWKPLAAVVLVCAVIVGAVQWRANHRIANLNEQLVTLQMQMNDIQNGVAGQLSGFTAQMHSMLEEQTRSIFNPGVHITRYSLADETVTVSATATAKEWDENTTGQFSATLGDGSVRMADAACGNGIFTVENWVLPMDRDGGFDAQFSITLWDDGVARTSSVESLYVFSDELPLHVSGTINPGRISLKDNVLTVTQVVVDYELGYFIGTNNPLAALDFCVYRNDSDTPEQVYPLTEFVETANQNNLISSMQNICDLGETGLTVDIQEGDTVLFALRVEDSFGNVSYALAGGRKLEQKSILLKLDAWSYGEHADPWTPGDLSNLSFSHA